MIACNKRRHVRKYKESLGDKGHHPSGVYIRIRDPVSVDKLTSGTERLRVGPAPVYRSNGQRENPHYLHGSGPGAVQ